MNMSFSSLLRLFCLGISILFATATHASSILQSDNTIGDSLSLVPQENTFLIAKAKSCPSGNGLYCGSSSLGQNTDYLYKCSSGDYKLSKKCDYGCQKNPPGKDDSCKSPKCPSGNGLYCGSSSLGQNTNYLYQCKDGSYTLSQQCSNGCQKNSPGVNDTCKADQTATGKVVIIDGIQILSILNPNYPNNYSHYLLDAIMNSGNWPQMIQQQVGQLTPFEWSRDFSNEDEYVSVLSALLEKYSNDNKKTGGKLIVLAHSWGTVLAYIAIATNSNITVDKLITLGSPLNAQNDTVRTVTISDISEWMIKGSPLQIQHPSNVATWDNYWEKCDPISGSITVADNNYTSTTNYYDPETAYQSCHSAYYEDQLILTSILLDVIAQKK